MSSDTESNLQTRAIEWHVRLRNGDDATWDAFADWLAQDPRHTGAYEAIEQIEFAIEPLLPQLVFPETEHAADRSTGTPVSPVRRWWFAGGALAASIVAGVAFLPQLTSGRYDVTTGPGQRQTVALDATTEVMLNGSTRMTFDRKNPRFASLASGEALFRVHHDNAKPFTLDLGSNSIQDVGTVFNVVRDSSQVRVAVAEGKVIYNTSAQVIPLGAGQALLARSDSATVRITSTPTASIGAWQSGRLVYSGEPLSQVAADLERTLGVHIDVSPSLVDRAFSGAIVLQDTGSEQLEHLKLALNVDLEAGPTGWTMKPLDDGGR
jgi:transmembrane sensor